MSKYSENKTGFKDASLLCEALAELGYSTVEVHEQATNLYGYHGDKRADLANVIVRRLYVGSASNDIGFKRNLDGSYSAIISEYDSYKHNAEWMRQLKESYGNKLVQRKAKQLGLRGSSQKVNGKTVYTFVKA